MTNKENTEKHVCKICGQRMDEKFCMLHKTMTGHSEFKPCEEYTQNLRATNNVI